MKDRHFSLMPDIRTLSRRKIMEVAGGKIIERKNLGVHILFRKLTAQNLFEAVEKTQTPAIRQNAVKMGEQINREEGLKKTIDKLEDYFTIDLKS